MSRGKQTCKLVGAHPGGYHQGRFRRGSHQSVICGAEMTQQRKLDLILSGKRRHTEDRGQERLRRGNAEDAALRRGPTGKRIKAERWRKACKFNVRQESLRPWPSIYINVPSLSKPHAAATLKKHKYFRERLLSPSISLSPSQLTCTPGSGSNWRLENKQEGPAGIGNHSLVFKTPMERRKNQRAEIA